MRTSPLAVLLAAPLTETLTATLAAALATATAAPASAQGACPPSGPATHATIAAFDAHTVLLGQFEGTPLMLTAEGEDAVKTALQVVPDGLHGSLAGTLVQAPAIYALPAFDRTSGTIEMWVRPGPDAPGPSHLFSLAGRRSLDGDGGLELMVGEPVDPGGGGSTSQVYFNDGTGLDLAEPAVFESWAPRGATAGDVDGDGFVDLIVAHNDAATLPFPLTPALPGEIHVYRGPLVKGEAWEASTVIEIDYVQGVAAADLDQDGDLDLVASSFAAVTPAVVGLENDGTGHFTYMDLPYAEIVASGEGLALGDVNRDGVLDVLYGSLDVPPSRVVIGKIDADGYGFQDIETTSSDRVNHVLGVSLGDVTGDGWPDAVLAQPLYDHLDGGPLGRVVVHANHGDGTFPDWPTHWVRTTQPFTLNAQRDVDNDGWLDIVVANWRDGSAPLEASTVLYGPFLPVDEFGRCEPERAMFAVEGAVSAAIGDVDGDGLHDLFFRSGTGTESALFLLDADGAGKSGLGPGDAYLPDLTIPTVPTLGAGAGNGATSFLAYVGGTTAYGSINELSNSIDLWAEDGSVRFRVVDAGGHAHEVTAPLPAPDDADAIDGFHHVQAEWSAAEGLVQLRVGHPSVPEHVWTSTSAPFAVGPVAPLCRLGTDAENQSAARDWGFDDVRVSDVRRSTLDLDGDGVQDDWDVCPDGFDPDQLDTDGDGVGDACTACQQDLGKGGPGTMSLALCGQGLASCQSATLSLAGAPPLAPVWMFFGLGSLPVPFYGGTLLPWPQLGSLPLVAGPDGVLTLALAGGLGPLDLVMQAVALDAGLPQGVALSNGIKASFQP